MKNNFIKLKNNVLITTILLIMILVSIFLYLTISEKKNSLNKELEYKKSQLELVYMKYIEQQKLKYSNKLRIFLNSPDAIKAFAKRDRKALNKIIQPYFEILKKEEPNFEIICFGLPDSRAFLRAHKPEFFGDDISKVQGVKIVNETKREVGGFMLTKLGLYYRVNAPVYYDNKYIGLVSFGINIASVNDFVANTFNSDVAVLIDTQKYKDKDWYERVEEGTLGKYTIISSTDDFIEENSKRFNMKSKTQKVLIDNKEYFTHKNNSIYDLNNNKIATILLLQDITKIKKDFNLQLIIFILFAFILLLLIILVLVKSFNKMINKIIDLNKTLENKVEIRTKELAKQVIIAQKAVRIKGEFLANMSHEIRTPLNAILGFVGILKENEQDNEKLKYLTIVDKSSQSLLSIINDILDFSKIESGKIDIENVDFNPYDEFEIVAELFKAKSKEKNINFKINIDNTLPNSINSDIQKLKQIISNLLSNAIKFTNDGKSVELKIYYENKNLFVYIKDEGIGIPKDRQRSVFEAFSQADSSTSRKFGGTGLGLSISSSFVKLLNGKLELKSQENKGSEFYFSIPIKIGQEIKKEVKNTNIDLLKGRILVVEDNKANQMFMKVILKNMNLEFDIANDGIEAIKKFNSNQYTLILMDENMPNMNGIEATKQILTIEKENNIKHTPIIALTANALKGDRKRFLDAGMDEYLTKPINKDKLYKILVNFIK